MNLKKSLCYGAIYLTVVYVYASQEVFAQPGSGQPSLMFIKNNLSGKCLDVSGSPGTANGTPLTLSNCETFDRNTDQRWRWYGTGFIVNGLSGKCLDVAGSPGTANGTPLTLSNCEWSDPNTDQKWRRMGRGFIVNKLSGKCIDVAGAPGQQNGSRLVLWDCETSGRNRDNGSVTDQQWGGTGGL